MALARFFVDAELARFLPRNKRSPGFAVVIPDGASLKNLIESIGIPHTEIAEISIEGYPVRLDDPAPADAAITLRSWLTTGNTQPTPSLRFVADAHLGGLTRYMRMLGFDTLHDGRIEDSLIRSLARSESRTVLSRDRELLKCADVKTGSYVRAIEPVAQLREVDRRFGLAPHAHPFTRCLRCNGTLHAVDKSIVMASLPPAVAHGQNSFVRCADCHRIYWPGSHYERMRTTIRQLLHQDLRGSA